MQCATVRFENQSYEPPPAPGDSPREIAEYVWFVLCDANDRAPTRSELRAYCQAEGYAWNHVARELRWMRLIRSFDVLAGGASSSTSTDGIRVNEAEMTALIGDMRSICPFTLSFVDTWTFQRASHARACESWCCPQCGPSNAERLLKQVQERIAPLREVFVGDAPWEPKLAARVRRRRADRGFNLFWYHRIDDTVFYVADKPFGATGAPTSCRALSPAETSAWLAQEVMWVPGHDSHGFSTGWAFHEPTVGGGDLLSMAGLNDREITEVMKTFTETADRRFGVRVDRDEIPREHHDELVALLIELRDNKRSDRRSSNSSLTVDP